MLACLWVSSTTQGPPSHRADPDAWPARTEHFLAQDAMEAYGSTRFRTIPFRNATMESTDFVACLKGERARQLVAAFFQVAATMPGNLSDINKLRL